MYRVYIFGMVGLRSKRSADKDSDRQHPRRLHRDSFNCGSFDPGLHPAAHGMYLYIFSMVRMSVRQQADEKHGFKLTGGLYRNAAVDPGMQLCSSYSHANAYTNTDN